MDKVHGRSCHQCRQKAAGRHVHCTTCSVYFDGDCLFMRYGENVDEAMANPNWQCPK